MCDGCERGWTSSTTATIDNVCVYKNTSSDVNDEAACETKFGTDATRTLSTLASGTATHGRKV